MPGVDRLSIDALVEEAGAVRAAGLGAVILFGIPDVKDPEGTGAYDDEGIVQLAVRALKAAHPDLVVITDVCLCEYTSHGHCGLLREDGSVENDSSVELLARPAGRLPRLRRVLDAQGGRRRGHARRARRRARVAHLHPARRRRHRHHLLREGRRRMAQLKVRSRKGGAAVPLTDSDRALLNVMQGRFPIEPRPYATVARELGIPEADVLARIQELLDKRIIRQVTPIYDTRALGYKSMLVAAKVDPENPWRPAKIVHGHPGVSHNYLRNHDFNMWFTIAVEEDSKLGLEGTLDVLARETGAESVRMLPTLKLFKIRMDLEMEQGTDALATAAEAVAPAPVEKVAYDEVDKAVIRATQGDLPVVPEPYAAAAAEVGMSQEALIEHLLGMQERGILRRVAAILFHRRAGFSAHGIGG